MTHVVGECPGLGQCENSWHVGGCEPHWQYADMYGNVLSGYEYAETDAMSKSLWSGPDGPDEIWHRRSVGGRWVREA